jgi:hypothetical protein
VLFDLRSATNAAETMFSVANQAAEESSVSLDSCLGRRAKIDNARVYSPPNEILRLSAKLLVWREVKVAWPVDNLPVGVMWLFRAERWPTD